MSLPLPPTARAPLGPGAAAWSVSGRVCIVTGANSGIGGFYGESPPSPARHDDVSERTPIPLACGNAGKEVAAELAAQGADVVMACRSQGAAVKCLLPRAGPGQGRCRGRRRASLCALMRVVCPSLGSREVHGGKGGDRCQGVAPGYADVRTPGHLLCQVRPAVRVHYSVRLETLPSQ